MRLILRQYVIGLTVGVGFCICAGMLSAQQNNEPIVKAKETGTMTGKAAIETAPSSGAHGTPRKVVHFTGISHPFPGEMRAVPGTVEKPTTPIPGTTVHAVMPSGWMPGVSRLKRFDSLNGAPVPFVSPNENGGKIPVPVLAPEPKNEANEQDKMEATENATPDAPQSEPMKKDESQPAVPQPETPPTNQESVQRGQVPLDDPFGGYTLPSLPAYASEISASEKIYGIGPRPRVESTRPVAALLNGPDEGNVLVGTMGPPQALRFGMVTDEGILNTPYAPGEASPKVWSNGREVTATERAQLAEGRAPIIRRHCVMAKHMNVATNLPHFCDGLEHCPVCFRPYLCGCGEEDCRFCNPDKRIGPSPVCSCCGDKRPCIHGNTCKGQLGHAPYREWGNTSGGIACPICKQAVETVPCGCCEKCLKGETCEKYKPCGKCPSCLVFEKCDLYKAHRNCVLPNKTNSCNRCDNRINGEPCGTCDWCRENSDLIHEPCGHQEVGLVKAKTVYNPYNERKAFSAPPRWLTDRFNNRSSKFPIYYNPAPYYKDFSNPSLYAGYARPFTFRYTCAECNHDPCTCTAPGKAGQVEFAYACKFCNRTPCACAAEICNVNMSLNPKEVRATLDKMAEEEKTKTPPVQTGEQKPEDGGFVPATTPDVKPQTPEAMWKVPDAPIIGGGTTDLPKLTPAPGTTPTQPDGGTPSAQPKSEPGKTSLEDLFKDDLPSAPKPNTVVPGSGSVPLGAGGRVLGAPAAPTSESTIVPGQQGRVLGSSVPAKENTIIPGAKTNPLNSNSTPLGTGGRSLSPTAPGHPGTVPGVKPGVHPSTAPSIRPGTHPGTQNTPEIMKNRQVVNEKDSMVLFTEFRVRQN